MTMYNMIAVPNISEMLIGVRMHVYQNITRAETPPLAPHPQKEYKKEETGEEDDYKTELKTRLEEQIRTYMSTYWKCSKSLTKPYPSRDLHSREHNSKCMWNPLTDEAVKKPMQAMRVVFST